MEGRPKIKLGINGFSCIGRLMALVALELDDVQLVAINDPLITPQNMADILKNDYTHDLWKKTKVPLHSQGHLIVHGNKIAVLSFRDPSKIPWSKEGDDFVVESMGVFTDKEKVDILEGIILQILGYGSSRFVNGTKMEAFNRKDYYRVSKKAKMDQQFQGMRSKVKDAYVVRKKQNLENLDEIYPTSVPNDYVCISYGTVVVQDKNTEEMVLVVKFLPFDEMTIEEYKEYKKITSTLISVKKGASHVTCNGPKKIGDMYAVGWRAGQDGGLTFGRYVPSRQVQQRRSSLHNWEEQQALLSEVSNIYGKHFCKLAPSLFEHVKVELQSAEVPSLSQTEFNILHAKEDAFSSNLTYTIKDFSNCFHRDNDFSSYAFGLWAPTSFDSGDLKSQKNSFESRGGEFLLGSYKVCIDLNACDGIVEMIWRSNTDFHCTVPSTTSADCTRIGSSVQMSNALVQRMKKLSIEHMKGKDISKIICGVNKIMQLKLKKAKY